MITDQIISITDLRQGASKIIEDINRLDRIIVIHNKPKAALISIQDYEKFKRLQQFSPEVRENVSLLVNNPSFDFLKDEPDLYEDISSEA